MSIRHISTELASLEVSAAKVSKGALLGGNSEVDGESVEVMQGRLAQVVASISEAQARLARSNTSSASLQLDTLAALERRAALVRGTLSAAAVSVRADSGSGRGSPGAAGLGSVSSPTHDPSRYQSHLGNLAGASNAADSLISRAENIHGRLDDQHDVLLGTSSTLGSLTHRIPILSSLMTGISRRRQRDRLVLAGTFAFCCVFLMLYWWNFN
jgi:hypothetical protein